MSSAQIDKILNVYKLLCQIPSLASARIICAAEKAITVQSVWSQKNLEKRSKQKFIQEFHFTQDFQPLLESFPVDNTTEVLTAFSEDENLKAVLRDVTVDGKSKQFIEIWNKTNFSKSYDLSAFDVHGDVYADTTFSSFQWSPDNTRLLYVAEKKLPKSEPFYKQKSKPKTDKSEKAEKADDEEEPTKGTEYVFKPDWGEQLVGKHRSVVVVLNVKEDTIAPLKTIPSDYFPGQVLWCPNGNDIVGVAYKLKTIYLGLYACTNREACIFHLKGSEFCKLSSDNLSCSVPRFSPNGKYLVWLERDLSPAHHNVQRLMCLEWGSTEHLHVLVNVVEKEIDIADGKQFYGLYNYSLPQRCWSSDSKYIFVSTPQRSNIKSYVVNLETKVMHEIDVSDGSTLIIADVKNNYIACNKMALNKPHQLLIGKFDPSASNIGKIDFVNCTTSPSLPNEDDLMYEHTEFVYDKYDCDVVKEFNFTYFGKKSGSNQSVPLIAVGHGGPHASHCNMFYPFYALLTQLDFAVLLINYRGSTGMGGDNVNFLLGKVGDIDVKDCVTAIDTAVKKYPWIDPRKVNIYGGSHGGFLGAHLSGQYPDKFKSIILLNPVIDMLSMYSTTDIPDWCRAENGCSILKNLPEASDDKEIDKYSELPAILTMFKNSPIFHANKVKSPTFLALGSKDLRVPCSQGKLWYNRLTENGVVTKLFMYEDNHSLMKDEVEIDNVINIALWLLEHNNN